MDQPLSLHFNTAHSEIIEICNRYWHMYAIDQIPYYSFTYLVKEIALDFNYRPFDITQLAAHHCMAQANCTFCKQQLSFNLRTEYSKSHDYHGMKFLDDFKGVICEQCRELLPIERYRRSLIDPPFGIYYFLLQKRFEYVMVDFHLSTLVVKEGIIAFFKQSPSSFWSEQYYEQARFSYVVFGGPDASIEMVIDHITEDMLQKEAHATMIAFKKEVLAFLKIPYYLFPQDQAKLFTEEEMVNLMTYLLRINSNSSAKKDAQEQIIIRSKI